MAADVLLTGADLVIVVVVVRCAGALAARLGEPRIAGEMIGALLVGPTVLGGSIDGVAGGQAAHGLVGALFPADAVSVLTALGLLGMILFMLLIGLTIDPVPMRRRGGLILGMAAAIVASTAVVAIAAAAWLQADGGWVGGDAQGAAFALALCAALAVHGVPIAARILEERSLLRSEIGGVVIATGACVTTISLIAAGVAIRGGDLAALARLAVIVACAALVVAVAAPLARSRSMRLSPPVAIVALVAIAVGAGVGGRLLLGTVLIGPLIVGVVVRTDGDAARYVEARLGKLVRGVLLPIFLGVAALHTNVRELGIGALVPVCVVTAAVVVAKVAGAYVAARAAGFDRSAARAMGGLLQCGGVMTIAISLDLLAADTITTRTHAMMTIVGLVTTLVAGPLLAASGLRGGGSPSEGATPRARRRVVGDGEATARVGFPGQPLLYDQRHGRRWSNSAPPPQPGGSG